jgi:two-component system, LuxR family, response regulator FixJ
MQHEPIVYVVDDDEAIRSALRLLMKSADLRVVTCASAEEFLKVHKPELPGCLVLDIRMPGMNGLELQRLLNDRHIRVPVVIMSGHGDVSMAVQAMKDGAVDFIEKPFKNEVLLERVKQCVARDVETRKEQREHVEAATRIASLTPREREVMELLIQGKRNKIIASDLGISNRTVEAHRAKIMEKMHAHSLSEIVRTSFAAEEGSAEHG